MYRLAVVMADSCEASTFRPSRPTWEQSGDMKRGGVRLERESARRRSPVYRALSVRSTPLGSSPLLPERRRSKRERLTASPGTWHREMFKARVRKPEAAYCVVVGFTLRARNLISRPRTADNFFDG